MHLHTGSTPSPSTLGSRHASDVTTIYHRDGRTLLLDHAGRRFAKADEKSLPKKRVNRSMYCVSAPELLEGSVLKEFLAALGHELLHGCRIVRTVLRDAPTRCDWQHYFMCDPSLGLTPAVLETVLTLLAGNRECQTEAGFPWDRLLEAVSVAGLPVVGGMVPLNTAATSRRGSAFKLENVRLGDLSVDKFAAPSDYKQITPGSSDEPAGPQVRMASDPNTGPGGTKIRGGNPATEGDGQTGRTQRLTQPLQQDFANIIIGLFIPQSALDSIRNTANQGALPFSKFAISNGVLTIDWLAQMRADWISKKGAGGTMLYCALHDDTLPAPGAPAPALCSTFTGKGRLDALASLAAEKLVNAGTLTASILTALPSAAVTELTAVGRNWNGLSNATQLQIACQVLWQNMAVTQIPVGAPLIEDLEIDKVNLATISGHLVSGQIVMPAVMRSMSPGTSTVIESCPIISTLVCRDDATIEADVTLGEIDLFAQFQLIPTATFWEIVGLAHLASVLFPPLAALTTHIATVGIELLAQGSNGLTISITNPKVVCTVGLRQAPDGIFRPVVDASVTAGGFSFAVGLPPITLAGIFEALQFAFQGWAYRAIFPMISQMVTPQIYLFLQGIFGSGFPDTVSNLGIPILGGMSAGGVNNHVYFESWLGSVPGSNPIFAEQITMNGYQEMLADVAALKAGATPLRGMKGMHCFSLNLSQNALNVINAARMQSSFVPLAGATTQAQDLSMLAALAKPPVQQSFFQWVSLYALAPPHITLSPNPDPLYATADLQFSLSALSIDPISAGLGPIPGVTWTFRVSSPVKVVLGAATPENGGPLTSIVDFKLFPDHIFDILFDLDSCGILLQTMSVYSGGGGMPQSVPITPTLASQQEAVIRAALKIICGEYGLAREPIRDSASPTGTPNDDPLEQTYTIDGSDPDLTGLPTLEIPVALGLHPQLLHMHVQLFGALGLLLDGTVSLGANSSDCALGRSLQSS